MKWFECLKTGLMMINLKGEIRQPHNEAMGNIARGYPRWQTASSYLYDIERILLEMKMARSFLDQLPDDSFYETHAINAEDYIMYHNGFFLDLVHQLKDKATQMINAIVNPDEKYSSKTESGVKLSKVLNNERVKRIPGLAEALGEWDDSSHKGPIAIALKKRTNYHHFKNPLTGTESYYQTKAQRTLLKPDMLVHLSEYGRQMIGAKQKETLGTWHEEAKEKMRKTSEAIDKNLEAVSKAILDYYRFPKADELEGKRVLMRYLPMLEAIRTVANTKTIADIEPISAEMLRRLTQLLQEVLGEDFLALYVTGSMARGDFNFGLSDVNIVIVIKRETEVSKEEMRAHLEAPAKKWGIPTDIQFYLESEFMGEGNERIRFICKTDGIQIFGSDLLKYEPLPNKSYRLVWMLNKDFKEKLAKHREWIEAQPSIDPSSRQAALVARDLAKRAYRMAFGQVIGNHTVYATSFKDMRHLFLFYTPENRRFIDMTYRVTQKYPWADKDALIAMVDAYERNLMPLYDRVNEVANGIQEGVLTEGANPTIPTVSATASQTKAG